MTGSTGRTGSGITSADESLEHTVLNHYKVRIGFDTVKVNIIGSGYLLALVLLEVGVEVYAQLGIKEPLAKKLITCKTGL